MTLPTISMPRAEARDRLEAWRRSLRRRRSPDLETRAIVQGYEALSLGRPLIDLHQAIGEAGWDEEGRPRLAIARADRRSVEFCRTHRLVVFDASSPRTAYTFPTLERKIPLGSMPPEHRSWEPWRRACAVVPIIPPTVRERGQGRLQDLFVLWEAEWEDVPADPYLLRHLAGSLYAVLAQWDLTPVEQLVLRGRLDGGGL